MGKGSTVVIVCVSITPLPILILFYPVTTYSSTILSLRLMGLDEHVGDHQTRLKLLSFSITHCPPEEIAVLLKSRQALQFQVIRKFSIYVTSILV